MTVYMYLCITNVILYNITNNGELTDMESSKVGVHFTLYGAVIASTNTGSGVLDLKFRRDLTTVHLTADNGGVFSHPLVGKVTPNGSHRHLYSGSFHN